MRGKYSQTQETNIIDTDVPAFFKAIHFPDNHIGISHVSGTRFIDIPVILK